MPTSFPFRMALEPRQPALAAHVLSGGANGNGTTPEDAVADLREAVQMVIDEDGVPEQLARTLDLEVA
jgi:hypothetical protein